MAATPDLLNERGLFLYDSAALTEIAQGFGELSAAGEEVRELHDELVHLTAAEFALTRWLPYRGSLLPLERPLQVEHQDGVTAFLKTNCNPIFCFEEVADRDLGLTDLMAFGSDVSKLHAAAPYLEGGESIEENAIGSLARAVDFLESRYRASASARGREFGESGILRLQGFLWAVKATLRESSIEQAVSDSYDAFELSQPVGGAAVPVPVP